MQLLDSPPFTPLRLALLAPREHPHLTRALYALLALLPQGNAFRLLSTRLQVRPGVLGLVVGWLVDQLVGLLAATGVVWVWESLATRTPLDSLQQCVLACCSVPAIRSPMISVQA